MWKLDFPDSQLTPFTESNPTPKLKQMVKALRMNVDIKFCW
jgi:hypothetical protein